MLIQTVLSFVQGEAACSVSSEICWSMYTDNELLVEALNARDSACIQYVCLTSFSILPNGMDIILFLIYSIQDEI